jgi:hypothetical protein
MTDRELLELAAKASGYPLIEATRRLTKDKYFEIVYNAAGNRAAWNPLTDDGDALRLAVKLNMDVSQNPVNVWACAAGGAEYEVKADDPYAATRRAIVRAAAEIGRAKELE